MFNRLLLVCIAGVLLTTTATSQIKEWPNTFLWRITGNGLTKPSFLYGTIHLSDKKLFYFSDSLYRYLEQAEGFNIEVDADSLITASVKKWNEQDNGRTLKSVLAKYEFDKYADKLSKTLNKPADKITTEDIWYAKNRKLAIEYQKGTMSNFMDFYLYGIAKKQGKQVGGIEDLQDQLSLMDEMFDDADLQYLVSDSIQELSNTMLKNMKNMYVKEDLKQFDLLFNQMEDERFKDTLLIKRNVKMALRMDSLAHVRSSFFAVGVAHLPGDSGVINLLLKKGFNVQPVFSKKKVAPETYTFKEVSIPWNTYTHELNLYSIKLPGVPQPMDAYKQVMDMQYYYDVASSKMYYTAVINTTADESKKDSLFTEMINRMAADGKLVSKNVISNGDIEGRDVLIKVAAGETMRLKIFMTRGLVYMAGTSSKNSTKLRDAETDLFFNSFSLTPAASLKKSYFNYIDTVSSFSVLLPGSPAITFEPATEENGEGKMISSTDFNTGHNFVVSVSNVRPGLYLANDSNTLAVVRQNLGGKLENDTTSTETTVAGLPALIMNGTGKNESAYFRTVTIFRGNRTYTLIAVSKKDAAANPVVDTFLKSFKLLDFAHATWGKYTASDSSFSTWLPGPFIVKTTGAVDRILDTAAAVQVEVNDYISYDKATSTSYHIEKKHFEEYYSSTDDSTFFMEQVSDYLSGKDSIVLFNLTKDLKDKSANVRIENPGSSFIKRIRFVLHGDTLYKVFTYSPKWLINDANIERFFAEFSLSSPAPFTTLFTPKIGKLIADLQSADSVAFEKASGYLYDAKLDKRYLQDFHPLLIRPFRDFSETVFYSTNIRLADALLKIADSSTVKYIQQNYATLQGHAVDLQYPLLRFLVKMDQPFASEAAATLIRLPVPPHGDPGIFTPALSDNLPFAKSVLPQILAFSSDTAAALEYAYVIATLLDSNLIDKSEVIPHLSKFITAGSRQKTKWSNSKEDYDYSLTGIIDLFGKINNAESNRELQLFSTSNNLHLKFYATKWLIRNSQAISPVTLNKLAASDYYRTDLYDELIKAKRSNLFPATFLNQKMFAAAYVYNYASDDYAPKQVQFVAEKTVNFKGKLQKFYLFKVTFDEDGEASHSLGIAGPFSLDGKVTTDNEATGLYWKEEFSAKAINFQFVDFLKQVESPED